MSYGLVIVARVFNIRDDITMEVKLVRDIG